MHTLLPFLGWCVGGIGNGLRSTTGLGFGIGGLSGEVETGVVQQRLEINGGRSAGNQWNAGSGEE